MKRLLYFIAFGIVFSLTISCHKDKSKYEQLVTEKIQYDVSIKNNDCDIDWWIQNIEGPQRDKFINLLFNAVEDNKIKIYNMNQQIVSLENIVSNLFTFDTIHLQKNGKNKQIIDTVFVSSSFNFKNVTKIRFDEKWKFNTKTLLLSKEIKGFCPILVTEMGEDNAVIELPLFWVYPDTVINSDTSNNYIITKKIQYDVFVKSEDKGKDWWMNNIETSDRENFLKEIINAAIKEKIKTYDYFNKPLDKKKLKEILHRTDSVSIENLDNPYENIDTVMTTDYDQSSIVKIRFIEEWSINTQSFRFYKKVLAICPMIEGIYNRELGKCYTPLFWIYFDESLKNAE
ncbi:MAG: hypothetical protein ACOYO1_06295 [Bacteroidales bacterium]